MDRLVMTDRFGQKVEAANPCVEPWLMYALRNTPVCDLPQLLEGIVAIYPDGSPVPHGSLSVSVTSGVDDE